MENYIEPYDYIKDSNGNIYLAKGLTKNKKACLAKLVYVRIEEKIIKSKSSYPKASHNIPFHRAHNASHMDYIIELKEIVEVVKFKNFRLTESKDISPIIKEIVRLVNSNNGKAYLFGSRILKIDNSESDWDLIITGIEDPKKLVSKIIMPMSDKIRVFNHEEIMDRVNRYSKPNGFFRMKTLLELFKDTTLYLKYFDFEIGLFFSGGEEVLLPDFESLSNSVYKSIVGEIVSANGASFHIPRSFKIKTPENEILNIITPIWELGGLELLEGKKITINGLQKINNKEWWLGGSNSEVIFN